MTEPHPRKRALCAALTLVLFWGCAAHEAKQGSSLQTRAAKLPKGEIAGKPWARVA